MYVLIFGAASFLGAAAAWWLGWLNSKEKFKPRKCIASMLTAVVTSIGSIAAVTVAPPDNVAQLVVMLSWAFMSAPGIDAFRHYAYGAAKKSKG